MNEKLIKEFEESHKSMMELTKNFSHIPKIYADGIIGEYQRIADENRKSKKVTKYKKIKIYRKV